MNGIKTYPARPQNPGPGKPRTNIPLNLYLNKLLDPAIIVKPPESPQQPPVPEPAEAPASPAPAVSTWQRAKSGATKTLRAAAARRHSRSEAPSPMAMTTAKPAARLKTKARTSTQAAVNGRQRIMMASIPVLAIVLVLAVKNPLKVSPADPVQSALPTVAAPTTIADVEIAWQTPPLYQPGVRDPMRLPDPPVRPTPEATDEPEVAPKQTRIELVVSGILYSQDRPAAIVDTQLVHEGQQISGATVKKIEMDGVEFEWNGQTWKQTVDQ